MDDGPPPLMSDDHVVNQASGAAPGAGAGLGNLAGMADMLRGMGGGGGGGMPDIASMMNDPRYVFLFLLLVITLTDFGW